MKPSSKREKEVVALSKKLPRMTEPQRRYCIDHCFEHQAIRRGKHKTECICLECGKTFNADCDAEVVTCPHCHTDVKPYVSRRQYKKQDKQSFQIITTAGDYQVVRTFYARQLTIPYEPAEYLIDEVSQIYMQPNEKDVILALNRFGLCGYSDNYDFKSVLSVKRVCQYTYSNPYYIFASVTYPRAKVLPILKRNGWDKALLEFCPTATVRKLFDNPHYETLAKAKRFDIWNGLERSRVDDMWAQVKMLIRHDYHTSDFGLWVDMIDATDRLGLDTHSPKYVLPADLQKMHDTLTNRLAEQRRREEEMRRAMDEKKKRNFEKKYPKLFGKLLGIVITVNDIVIKPLQNYNEFKEEGEAMHHCVETYWGKTDCLIMSARCGNKRLATIELDRSDFHVKQCRAVCNGVSERYDEICNAIKANTAVFRRAIRAS